MTDKKGIKEYIDLKELKRDERVLEFLKTVEGALVGRESEEYSASNFAYIINVACNKVSDMFDEVEVVIGDIYDECIVTSKYIPVSGDIAYYNFEKNVRKGTEEFKDGIISDEYFYNYLSKACDALAMHLEPRSFVKVKTVK